MTYRATYRLCGLAVFVVSLVIYLLTMQVTSSFWDSGEFIAASYILGIPHSPGTPLYVLVGRVFSMLPLPYSIAQRVNFLSVIFSSLGVLMAYMVMVKVLGFMYGAARSGMERFMRVVGPMVGAFFLTFSSTYWTDATEAEVYGLSAFVMGFCTLLALKWLENPSGAVAAEVRDDITAKVGKQEGKKVVEGMEREGRTRSRNLVYLIIYMLALGIGFHLGTIIVYGGILLLFLMVKEKAFSNFEILVFTFGFAVLVADMTMHRESNLTLIGLVVLVLLVIWSTLSHGKFALAATGLLVLGISVHLFLYIRSAQNPMIDEVDPETWRSLYAHLRREQYPPIDVFKRKASMLFQLSHFGIYFREQFRMLGDVKLGILNVGQATVAVPVALGLYGIVSSFSRERKTWVLVFTSLLLNSLGLILFLNFSDSEVRERDYFYGGAFFYFAMFIGIGATAFLMMLWDGVKEKGRRARQVLVPVGALLLVCSLLPAGYHWFRHDRSNNYIPRDYAFNILAGLEPDAIIFTNGDNDTFPLWYIQAVEDFRTDVRVANLSLLNTEWYIKQLRDEEPKVPISFTDAEIDALVPVATRDGKVLWRRDQAVHHIITETNWKRPVYFAVTVPHEVWEPYSEYLESGGMVRRLVPYKGDYLTNDFLMERNFDEIFVYRGIFDENGERDSSIYLDGDTRGMFVNFAIAAFDLGQRLAREGNIEEAARRVELAYRFDPSFPYSRKYLGVYYMRAGRTQEAIDHYLEMLREEPRNGDYWLGLASVYENMGESSTALHHLSEGARLAPDHRDLYGYGFRMAASLGMKEEARKFVIRWLDRHPDDREFRSLNENFDSFLESEFGIKADSADAMTIEP